MRESRRPLSQPACAESFAPAAACGTFARGAQARRLGASRWPVFPEAALMTAHDLIYGCFNDFPSRPYRPALEILQDFSAPLTEARQSLVYLCVTLSARVDPSQLLAGVNSTSLSFPFQAGHMCRGALFSSIRCQAHLGPETLGERLADSWEQRENSSRSYCNLQRAAAGWERDAAPGAVSLETAA